MGIHGALCSAISAGSEGRGSSARRAFSTAITCDVGQVAELADLLDVVEHLGELLALLLLLGLGQLEAREAGDVERLVTAQPVAEQ